jgi:hypothetical protein
MFSTGIAEINKQNKKIKEKKHHGPVYFLFCLFIFEINKQKKKKHHGPDSRMDTGITELIYYTFQIPGPFFHQRLCTHVLVVSTCVDMGEGKET